MPNNTARQIQWELPIRPEDLVGYGSLDRWWSVHGCGNADAEELYLPEENNIVWLEEETVTIDQRMMLPLPHFRSLG